MAARAIGRNTVNRRRKGALSVILPWLKRFGVLLAVAVFGVWLGVWLLLSGNFAKAGNSLSGMSAAMGFKVENIFVEGRVYSDAATLKTLIGVEQGAPLFSFDPQAARARIEGMDWIKSVNIERRLPDTVYVHLEEHKPLALWQKDKELHLVSEDGKIINTPRLGRFKDLMIVMGEGAPEHAPDLLTNLHAEPELETQSASAKWMDGRRWDLLLKNGVVVRLPEVDIGLALRRLSDAEKNDAILEKDITGVDLREADRIILRTKPGALQEYKAQQAALKTGDNI